jgi:hypothetical protein
MKSNSHKDQIASRSELLYYWNSPQNRYESKTILYLILKIIFRIILFAKFGGVRYI